MPRRQDLDVYVEFYALWAEDADEDEPGESPEPAEDELLASRDRRLCFRSGGHTHQAAFTAEVWDQEPAKAEQESWEASADAEWFCRSGEVALWSYGGTSESVVELGAPDTLWRVRAYVTGQERVRQLAQQEVPAGVERFLVQFWPA
ncbi:hypothetical protein [Streptomyces sp. HD]|uniref:hypothetical protein n=1 Tax=Streptomyces sp. HD TaxID=3020892 RepID=UPI00232BEC1B|nr:hypothetical protein [Streptomyces sp. HD]MDC0766739.1 hypothetical protein [Streptomyces sp. HD]